MATPKTTVPAPAANGITASSIAEAGNGLVRLWVAAFTLPINAAGAIGNSLLNVVKSATAALDGTLTDPGSNEVVKATGDVVKAGATLYTSLLNAAIGGLESLTKSINSAAAEFQKNLPK